MTKEDQDEESTQVAAPEVELAAMAVALTLRWPNGATLGPTEADLFDMIRRERSIIGASRKLEVSYRKCWLIVDALNRCFGQPVVKTFPGRRAWGAEITEFGERLLAAYRLVSNTASSQSQDVFAAFNVALDAGHTPQTGIAETP